LVLRPILIDSKVETHRGRHSSILEPRLTANETETETETETSTATSETEMGSLSLGTPLFVTSDSFYNFINPI